MEQIQNLYWDLPQTLCEQRSSENHILLFIVKKTMMVSPSLPHFPDPMLVMMGIKMLTALIASLIWDEEEWQWQAAMSVAVARAILEQCCQEWGEGDCAPPWKRQTFITWNHAWARDAVQEPSWGPLPQFNDRIFKRVFRVSRWIADDLLNTCAVADPFFQESIDCMGKVCICPKGKLLMALKILAYGVSPTTFQDYFHMGIMTAHACLKKFCKITS